MHMEQIYLTVCMLGYTFAQKQTLNLYYTSLLLDNAFASEMNFEPSNFDYYCF